MATHLVSSAAELEAAFAAAADGDRIELAAGEYGGFVLRGRSFAQGLTITSAEPGARAVLTDEVLIRETAGVTLTGLDFTADRVADSMSAPWIYAFDNARLTVSDMVITGHLPGTGEGADPDALTTTRTEPIAGYGYGLGLLVKQGRDVTLADIEFKDLRGAVKIGKSEQVALERLDIHDVREGVNLFDVADMEIAESRFYDFRPWKTDGPQGDDHPDMIQYWGKNSETGIHRLTIRDNLFYQPPEMLPTQTIFGDMRGAGPGVTATDFTITGNTIVNGRFNAVAIYDVTGLEITDNLVVPNSFGVPDPAVIDTPHLVLIDVRDALVAGNAFLPIGQGRPVKWDDATRDSGTVVIRDNTLLSTDPDDAAYWETYAAAVARPRPPDAPTPPPPPPDPEPEPEPEPNPEPEPEPEPDDPLTEGMNPDDIARYSAPDAAVIEGGAGDDRLRAVAADSFLFGFEGDDKLSERGGNDVMRGGAGADLFAIDVRSVGTQERDLILDLDFGEGDVMTLSGNVAGMFDDTVDPENGLLVMKDGASARIDSLADLAEIAAGGGLSYALAPDGDGLALRFAADPGRIVELAGYDPGDLLALL